MTVAEILERAGRRLAEEGVAAPCWDAERLLRHALGWDRAGLLSRLRDPVPEQAVGAFLALVEQRAARRPLQHIIGTQEFWRHEFAVSGDALIPRPETELLVEAALEALRACGRPTLVDVGTGSGCVALSIAAEREDAVVHAVDVSRAALRLAQLNARRLRLSGRVRFHHGDLLEPVSGLAGQLDLVVSNPPYADPTELPGLEPEVRDHEPPEALLPPGDRYEVYRRLIPGAFPALRTSGWLALEVGQGMADEVSRLCRANGFHVRRVIPDLQSIPRVVVAQRPTG